MTHASRPTLQIPHLMKLSQALLSFLLIPTLAACGGGGGGGAPQAQEPQPPATTPTTPTPTPTPSVGSSPEIESFGSWNLAGSEPVFNWGGDRHDRIFSSGGYNRPLSGTFVYTQEDGFSGRYSYEGEQGQITADVWLQAEFLEHAETQWTEARIDRNGRGLTMGGHNFGAIKMLAESIARDGSFQGDPYFSASVYPDTRSLRGRFSGDGNYVKGDVVMEGFHKSLFEDGEGNYLYGAFVAEKD